MAKEPWQEDIYDHEDIQHLGAARQGYGACDHASLPQSAPYILDGGDDRRWEHPASGRGDACPSRRALSRRAAGVQQEDA